MTKAAAVSKFYKDYLSDLKARIDDLRAHVEQYQVYDLRFEVTIGRILAVGAMSCRKGVFDSLFHMADLATGKRNLVTDAKAFEALDYFCGLGQFLALNGGSVDPLNAAAIGTQLSMQSAYPICALTFSYRKKGQPKTASMKMVFVGLNDDADAQSYRAKLDNPALIVDVPVASPALWEWR